MSNRVKKFSAWAEQHPLELGLYGALFVLTLVTLGISGLTLLEYSSHPMPDQLSIGLTLYFAGVAIELLALLIIVPIMLNQAFLAFEQTPKKKLLLTVLRKVSWPALWAFFAAIPLLSMAAVLKAISFIGIITAAVLLLVTLFWMSLVGIYLYLKSRRRRFASLWVLFGTLILSLFYPLIMVVIGTLLVALVGNSSPSAELFITESVFQLAQLSLPVALIYNGLATQSGGLFLTELGLVGQMRTMLMPWVIYCAFWGLICAALVVAIRLKVSTVSE